MAAKKGVTPAKRPRPGKPAANPPTADLEISPRTRSFLASRAVVTAVLDPATSIASLGLPAWPSLAAFFGLVGDITWDDAAPFPYIRTNAFGPAVVAKSDKRVRKAKGPDGEALAMVGALAGMSVYVDKGLAAFGAWPGPKTAPKLLASSVMMLLARAAVCGEYTGGARISLGGELRASVASFAGSLGATEATALSDRHQRWFERDDVLVGAGSVSHPSAESVDVQVMAFAQIPHVLDAIAMAHVKTSRFHVEVPRTEATKERVLRVADAPSVSDDGFTFGHGAPREEGSARWEKDHLVITRCFEGKVVEVVRVWEKRVESDRYMAAADILEGLLSPRLVEALADPWSFVDRRKRASDDELRALLEAHGVPTFPELFRIERILGGATLGQVTFGTWSIVNEGYGATDKGNVIFGRGDSGDFRIYVGKDGVISGVDDIEGGRATLGDHLETYLATCVAKPLEAARRQACTAWVFGVPTKAVADRLGLAFEPDFSTARKQCFTGPSLTVVDDADYTLPKPWKKGAKIAATDERALADALVTLEGLGRRVVFSSILTEVADELEARGLAVVRHDDEVLRCFSPPRRAARDAVMKLLFTDDVTPERADELALHDDEVVREEVAWHPATPLEALRGLAKDPSWIVRQGVASHVNSDRALLGELLGDAHWAVVEHALLHSMAPVEEIGDFVRAAHPVLRRAAALHVETHPTFLAMLAADRRPEVRHAAATNPFQPDLAALANDPHPTVSAAALANPSCPRTPLEAAIAAKRYSDAIKNPRLPADLLRRVADEAWREINLYLLAHPLPGADDLLLRFNDDDAEYARGELLLRPDCPVPILELAAADPGLAAEAATHPSLPDSTRVRLLEHGDPAVRAAAAGPLVPRSFPLFGFGENPYAFVHPDEAVRALVAARSCTAKRVLLELSRDPSPLVRDAVSKRSPAHVQTIRRATRDLRRAGSRFVEHPDCPAGSLLAEARRDDLNDRVAALGHVAFPPGELAACAHTGNARVLGAIAGNPWCDWSILEPLATSPYPYTRLLVAASAQTPRAVLELLAKDPDARTAERAKQQLKAPR